MGSAPETPPLIPIRSFDSILEELESSFTLDLEAVPQETGEVESLIILIDIDEDQALTPPA